MITPICLLVIVVFCYVWSSCAFYCLLCFCYWCGGFLAHNEDIVRSRCEGGEPYSLLKNLKNIVVFSDFGEFCTIFDWL